MPQGSTSLEIAIDWLMRKIVRHEVSPPPVEARQTISQPYIVAAMIAAA
jgi:hypothetical protein